LSRQFSLLGCEPEADALAMHLLAWSQGIATLANAVHDENFIREEVRQLHDWLQSLAGDPETRLRKPSKSEPKAGKTD
jgi:hypothetical protein